MPDVSIIADLFLKSLDKAGPDKLAVKYKANGQTVIYLLNSNDHTIRKREINVSGTLVEYTWRGASRERLQYATENNTFNLSGSSAVEVTNLYH